MTHTPGPWEMTHSDPAEGFDVWWIAGNHEQVEIGSVAKEANARLIAAAPDLLKTLEMMVTAFNQDHIDPMVAFATIEKARTAIAKATQ
jgi:biotin carboxylase